MHLFIRRETNMFPFFVIALLQGLPASEGLINEYHEESYVNEPPVKLLAVDLFGQRFPMANSTNRVNVTSGCMVR